MKWNVLGASMPIPQKRAVLDVIAKAIANATGMDWDETSYIRDSPGHVDGDSLDIAPRVYTEALKRDYATFKKSDPVLFRREALLRRLMGLALTRNSALLQQGLMCVVAVENDHLHIQIGRPVDPRDVGLIYSTPFGRNMVHRYSDSPTRVAGSFKHRA